MKKITVGIAGIALTLVAGVAVADPIRVIDFEDNALSSGSSVGGYATSVTSNGCTFTNTNGTWTGLENNFDGPDNGSTHLFGSDITMTCGAGNAFDLISWDLAEDYQSPPFTFSMDLDFADGTQLTLGPLTVDFSGWNTWIFLPNNLGTDLVSARWYTTGAGSDGYPFQISLDNINVPEPATLALLGLGLAGFGFSRRRT